MFPRAYFGAHYFGARFYGCRPFWIITQDPSGTWTESSDPNSSWDLIGIITDENGEPITDEFGFPITDVPDSWTNQSEGTAIWTVAIEPTTTWT